MKFFEFSTGFDKNSMNIAEIPENLLNFATAKASQSVIRPLFSRIENGMAGF